jgi:flavin reductase (DIM6/NTAB) family NADH-FMN oxidoreductase RutF
MSAQLFRTVMGRFATGVTVVTTSLDGEVFGMTANAFMAGSLAPPLCVVSIARAARMHSRLHAAGFFGVSFLSHEQRPLSDHFAGRSILRAPPEFGHLGRTPFVAGAVGAVSAEIVDIAECGDHTLFIGRILDMQADDDEPLLFYGGRYADIGASHRRAPPVFSFW